MSIFDPPNDEKLRDEFPDGTPFMLYAGDYEGTRDTTFGPQSSASVTAGPAGKSGAGERKVYKVWGTLAEQVAQMEAGDLPQLVRITKMGNRNVWTPVTSTGEDIPF